MGESLNMKKNLLKRIDVFSLYFLFLFLPNVIFAATYSISPASGSFEKGKSFTARVMINAGSDSVNSGKATVKYDTSKLTAVSVSKNGSPFNIWVTEPAISDGLIKFEGGGTTPFSGSKSIVTITFKAKAEGTAKVDFSNTAILAGPGTNVLSGSTGAMFTITPASNKTTPPANTSGAKKERNVKIPPPEKPVIKSSTHPDETEWYKVSDVKFSWDIPYGVLSVKIGFDQNKNGTSTELHKPPIGEWSKGGLEDGIWYFHAKYENRGGWGSSTTYKIQIDTTPPDEFDINAIGGDNAAELRFEAHDSLSGIDLYKVTIDGGRSRDVAPKEVSSGGYKVTGLEPGERTMTVAAIDKAGNERVSEVSVAVTGVVSAEKTDEVKTSGFTIFHWIILLLIAALAVVITMLVQERRRFHEEKDNIKRETMEIGDRLINIFGVLRDEIEEKVISLSHKPNMTDNERNILEGLKDALDISEELIDKEIEDVRKLLK